MYSSTSKLQLTREVLIKIIIVLDLQQLTHSQSNQEVEEELGWEIKLTKIRLEVAVVLPKSFILHRMNHSVQQLQMQQLLLTRRLKIYSFKT